MKEWKDVDQFVGGLGDKLSPPAVILLAGPACSGKTYVAGKLAAAAHAKLGFDTFLMSFAAPLKVAIDGGEAGIADLLTEVREYCKLDGRIDSQDIPELSKEIASFPRRVALQRLGTEIGRGMCSQGVWAQILAHRITGLMMEWAIPKIPKLVLVDDWRFPNEGEVLRLGLPRFVSVSRVLVSAPYEQRRLRGCSNVSRSHPSEAEAEKMASNPEMFDHVIANVRGGEK